MKTLFFKRAAIVIIAALTFSISAGAQEKGDMAAGGNFVLGAGDSHTNFGLGAKFQYNVITPLRLEGSFTYFFKKNFISMWDVSVNAHYLFHVADKITVYPLLGIGILGTKVDFGDEIYGFGGSASASNFGANLGGGIDYRLTDKLILNSELKYKVGGDWNRLLWSVGVAYKF